MFNVCISKMVVMYLEIIQCIFGKCSTYTSKMSCTKYLFYKNVHHIHFFTFVFKKKQKGKIVEKNK